jgi:hypothetical protein
VRRSNRVCPYHTKAAGVRARHMKGT